MMPRGWRWHTGLLARDSRVIAGEQTPAGQVLAIEIAPVFVFARAAG